MKGHRTSLTLAVEALPEKAFILVDGSQAIT